MREIKFRAFLKEKKKMLPVTYLTLSDEESEQVGVADCNNEGCVLCVDFYDYEKVELMQYTGLKDKNGKEMYFDSDVVKLTVWHGYVAPSVSISTHDVIDGIDSAKYEYTGLIQKDRFGNPFIKDFYFANLLDADKYEFEILGNIYENPELMEEQQNGTK